jgi:DNA repair photolyase
MNHDFEDIEIKRNAPDILEQQLKSKRKRCMITTGAMCDPYIHLEEELQYTRRCLEVIENYGFGLAIQTKSARILRDIDILRGINAKSKCVVEITLTTFDEDLCRTIEPMVSTTKERVAILEAMHDAGIPTVVWLCPTLPFINDSLENLRGLLNYCISTKVYGVMCFDFNVVLRPGNREYFYSKLDEYFPNIKQKYIDKFCDKYICISPNSVHLWQLSRDICKKHGIINNKYDVFKDFKF